MGVIGTNIVIRNCPVCNVIVREDNWMGLIINDSKSCECSSCGALLVKNNYSMPMKKGDIFFRLTMLVFLVLQLYFLFVVGSTRYALSISTCMFFFMAVYRLMIERKIYKWKVGKNNDL